MCLAPWETTIGILQWLSDLSWIIPMIRATKVLSCQKKGLTIKLIKSVTLNYCNLIVGPSNNFEACIKWKFSSLVGKTSILRENNSKDTKIKKKIIFSCHLWDNGSTLPRVGLYIPPLGNVLVLLLVQCTMYLYLYSYNTGGLQVTLGLLPMES